VVVRLEQQELVELEREFWRAITERDEAFYRRNLTDDFMLIDSDGVKDRAATLEMVQNWPGDSFSYQLEEPKVRELCEESILLTYRAQARGDMDGETFVMDVYVGTVYVYQHGQWLAAFHQETPVQA
jgi:hypothetical protein